MSASPFEEYRHPPKYARWLERTRAAYRPSEALGDTGEFMVWLTEAVRGLFDQVMGETDRLIARCREDGLSGALEQIEPYTLWGDLGEEQARICYRPVVTSVRNYNDTVYRNSCRGIERMFLTPGLGVRNVIGFDFKSAIAELTFRFSPWGRALLLPMWNGNIPTGGHERSFRFTQHKWKDAAPFDSGARLLSLLKRLARTPDHKETLCLANMPFRCILSADPGERASLYLVPCGSGPVVYSLVLYLPGVAVQREDAATKIQRWWRKAWTRLELERLYLRLYYSPGGPGALAAASSLEAAASSQ